MQAKNDALAKIVKLAQSYQITPDEIAAALNNQKMIATADDDNKKQKVDVTVKLFAYIGSIFILAGISVAISMFWSLLNSPARIIITLGTGLVLYILAILLDKNLNAKNMITPLFLLAAFFIPMGLFVTLHEYNYGGDWHIASLIIFGFMFLQQILTYSKIPKTVLVFTSLFFAASFYCVAFDYMNVNTKFIGLSLGISLLCVGYGLNKTSHQALSPLIYLIGGLAFLFSAFDYLQHTPIELLYLVITCLMIYLSVFQKSRTLLIVSTCALLSYISYFTSLHFVNSVGWPITLIILGCLFFAIGTSILKIHQKYIK